MGDYHTENTTPLNEANGFDKTKGAVPETPAKQTLIDRTVDALLTPPKSVYEDVSLELPDRYIDEPRSLRVAVIGAGLSGVLAGILLPAKVPGVKLTIFEKNADVVCLMDVLINSE